MKKLISMLLILTLFISFTSCSNKDDTTTVSGTADTANGNSKTTTAETTATTKSTTKATTIEAPEPEVQLEIEIVNNTVCIGNGSMVIKNNGQNISNNEDIPVMNDVRSIDYARGTYSYSDGTYFYIKNDNTLWAYGNNEYGQLGDGTGVNSQAGSEPVKILDNVANIYVFKEYSLPTIYAVTYDKELYVWGDNSIYSKGKKSITDIEYEDIVYAPIKIMDDVVDVPERGYVIKSDATLWTWDEDNILANPYTSAYSQKYDYGEIMPATKININIKKYLGNYTLIGIDNVLVYSEIEKKGEFSSEKYIGDTFQIKNVAKVFSTGDTLVFLKTDGTLWGKGKNTEGQLGDGTKVDKTEPVKIADNVKYYSNYTYLLNDGTYWTWDEDNPVPTQKYSGIYDVISSNIFLSENGELFSYNYGEKNIIFDDVKLP